MQLILDADGLIKLHRAGVLEILVQSFSCVVPTAVYDEAVTTGRARLYEDADKIDLIIGGLVEPSGSPQTESAPTLGAGEVAVLATATAKGDAIVVSDDRRFLSHLGGAGIPFVTPADMILVLFRRGLLSRDDTMAALELLRPMIRPAAYWESREKIPSEERDEE